MNKSQSILKGKLKDKLEILEGVKVTNGHDKNRCNELTGNFFFFKVNRAIFNFIWNEHNRIERNILIGKIEERGIGVIHIELKVKASKKKISETYLINEVINAYLKRINLNLN